MLVPGHGMAGRAAVNEKTRFEAADFKKVKVNFWRR
jgi:hypothetical protein